MRCNVGGLSSPNTGGGISLVKVWTNPNPNVTFVNLDLTIDLSKYKMIFVKFKQSSGDTSGNYAFFGIKKNINTSSKQLAFMGTTATGIRSAYFDDNSIHITTCDSNGLAIPIEVYATNKEIG